MGKEAAVSEHLPGNLIQLRFIGPEDGATELEAAHVAESLQGVVELTENLAKKGVFGEGPLPQVMVRPIQKGSAIIETYIQWALDPYGAFTVLTSTAGPILVATISTAMKQTRGARVEDFDYLGNGNIKIKWSDGTSEEIPEEAWNELNSAPKRTRRALKKILKPMTDGASTVQIRSGNEDESTQEVLDSPAVSFDRADLAAVSYEPEDTREWVDFFDTEARIESLDLLSGRKWRVRTPMGTRNVTIEDEEFLRRLDTGIMISKDTVYKVRIRENGTEKAGRKTREWTVVNIRQE